MQLKMPSAKRPPFRVGDKGLKNNSSIKTTSLEANGVSNHWHLGCLFNILFRWRTQQHQHSVLLALCEGNPPVVDAKVLWIHYLHMPHATEVTRTHFIQQYVQAKNAATTKVRLLALCEGKPRGSPTGITEALGVVPGTACPVGAEW